MGKSVLKDHYDVVLRGITGTPPKKPMTYNEYIGQMGTDCLWCHGRGKIVKPGERPDVYEGYKLADRITCPKCNGNRTSTPEVLKQCWKRERERSKLMCEAFDAKKKSAKSALGKLTLEEMLALGLIGQYDYRQIKEKK